ncbi:MAG: SLC13 family permease [Vicinamibacterales bacterium]
MSPALLSLIALVAALAVSMTSRINVGWLGIAFAWGIGVYYAGMRPDAVMAGFPVSLFLTLCGVTLLFAIADSNGTLGALARRMVRFARGSARAVPICFFLLACVMSSVGPGAISTVALLAPIAMPVGYRVGVRPLLTALMVANGANAGNLSPFSSVGVIANGAMASAGVGGHEVRVWFANFAAHVLVGAAAYAWMAGDRPAPGREGAAQPMLHDTVQPMTPSMRLTAATIAGWIASVLVLDVNLGLSAFAASAILLIATTADETAVVGKMPWAVIMMVCGVSVLISVMEKTGGMQLFITLLARITGPGTINGTIAFITGAISIYSSTSGVVLPAFLPTVPGLVARVGGGDPVAVALSINVGSSMVDVSPLSTLGALCVAAVSDPAEARRLFRALLLWGVSMTIVAAVLCQSFAGLLAHWP